MEMGMVLYLGGSGIHMVVQLQTQPHSLIQIYRRGKGVLALFQIGGSHTCAGCRYSHHDRPQ